jgi:hyperosmotically inducible periplasmic protein
MNQINEKLNQLRLVKSNDRESGDMRLRSTSNILACAAALSLTLAIPAFAQSDNGASAGESMNAAGQSMKNAGSDTANAAKEAYHGTATALHDTEITAKVKEALHHDSAIKKANIHVNTVAGKVTLRGEVASVDLATRAAELAQTTKGVREVDNKLKVSSASMAD